MRRTFRIIPVLAAATSLTASVPPRSTLHVVSAAGPVEWWRSDAAPVRWTAPHPALTAAFAWQPLRPGLDRAEATLLVNRGVLRLRVIAVRLDPAQFELRLVQRTGANGMRGTWTIDDAPHDAALALNAGQFEETGPWGWLVTDGIESRYPGRGPLSAAIAVDSAGAVHWIPDEHVFRARSSLRPRAAFQSYPVLLEENGAVPRLLRTSPDLDREHRDARLAMGRLPDGRLLFVITRFAGGGRLLERVPAGLTTPETAALMGALGARPALMLDGGLSAQLLLRDSAGAATSFPGGRRVPLALVALPRARH